MTQQLICGSDGEPIVKPKKVRKKPDTRYTPAWIERFEIAVGKVLPKVDKKDGMELSSLLPILEEDGVDVTQDECVHRLWAMGLVCKMRMREYRNWHGRIENKPEVMGSVEWVLFNKKRRNKTLTT